jgi:hypothetical protein
MPISRAVPLLQVARDPGLTLQEILASLPVDPASLFGLFLLLGFFGVVAWFGTRSSPGREKVSDAAPEAPPESGSGTA